MKDSKTHKVCCVLRCPSSFVQPRGFLLNYFKPSPARLYPNCFFFFFVGGIRCQFHVTHGYYVSSGTQRVLLALMRFGLFGISLIYGIVKQHYTV